jgi:sugar phosphate isomerase/epimerase
VPGVLRASHIVLPALATGLALAAPAGQGSRGERLRGAMVSPEASAGDLMALGRDLGANHVRWQLTWGGFPRGPADAAPPEAYRAWLEGALERLDEALPACARAGLRVIVDLHSTPGGRDEAFDARIFKEARWQDEFLRAWEAIARRYRTSAVVWGYDLANEPAEGRLGPGLRPWRELALETARRIRAVDADHFIVVEPAPWAEPSALAAFEPLPVSRVVYSVHMYVPQAFTHQGVFGRPSGLPYPGEIEGQRWDARALRRILEPVRAFQRRHGARIYVGEFSAIRWAPGRSALAYLEDVTRLFEEYGWDWSYHAFREWHGWSVEHGGDARDERRAPAPTDRARLLRSLFARNRPVPPVRAPAAFPGNVGVQLYSAREALGADLEGTLRRLAAAGFREVEVHKLWVEAPRYRLLLEAAGLRARSFMVPYERLVGDVAGVVADAGALGVEFVTCAWIPHAGAYGRAENEKAIADFTRAARALREAGLRFAYHPHGYEMAPEADGRTLLDDLVTRTPEGVVDFELDIYYVTLAGGDPLRWLRRYPGRFPLMHVKDMRRGTETGTRTGKTDPENSVALGTGVIAIPAIVREARAAGVEWFFIEDESAQALEHLPRSLAYLRALR